MLVFFCMCIINEVNNKHLSHLWLDIQCVMPISHMPRSTLLSVFLYNSLFLFSIVTLNSYFFWNLITLIRLTYILRKIYFYIYVMSSNYIIPFENELKSNAKIYFFTNKIRRWKFQSEWNSSSINKSRWWRVFASKCSVRRRPIWFRINRINGLVLEISDGGTTR